MINMPGFHPVDISYYLNSTRLMNTRNSIFRKLKYKPQIVFVQALTLNYISYTLFPEVYFISIPIFIISLTVRQYTLR